MKATVLQKLNFGIFLVKTEEGDTFQTWVTTAVKGLQIKEGDEVIIGTSEHKGYIIGLNNK